MIFAPMYMSLQDVKVQHVTYKYYIILHIVRAKEILCLIKKTKMVMGRVRM